MTCPRPSSSTGRPRSGRSSSAPHLEPAAYAKKFVRDKLIEHRHYIRQLEPAIPILRPLIEQLGYSVDDG